MGLASVDLALRRLKSDTEQQRVQFQEGFGDFVTGHELAGWEGWFSPYDEETYSTVLSHVAPDDVVLEIGAGDLRLALRIAERARRVYALEVNPLVVGPALQIIGLRLPRNLHVVCANALDFSIPPGITTAVLLMRHCQHFEVYFERLQAAGCRQLLTNARWRSGVEAVNLLTPRLPFEQVHEGWYACRCGAVGYVGRGERPDAPPSEVRNCPACQNGKMR